MANEKKAADNKAADRKPKKERRFHPIRYFREMYGEVKKLTWLTGKELVSHTIAVFVFVLAMALIIYLLDLGFSGVMSTLESINVG